MAKYQEVLPIVLSLAFFARLNSSAAFIDFSVHIVILYALSRIMSLIN